MQRIITTFAITLLMCVALPASAGNHGGGLPPGLQKKVEQGKPLPPGWQKKVDADRGDRLEKELYDYGVVRDIGDGRQEVEVEDRIYTVIKGTREIIDILDR